MIYTFYTTKKIKPGLLVLGVGHPDWTDKVVDHHHGEERGTSPVHRREAVRSAASRFLRAGDVDEEVDRASAKYRARSLRSADGSTAQTRRKSPHSSRDPIHPSPPLHKMQELQRRTATPCILSSSRHKILADNSTYGIQRNVVREFPHGILRERGPNAFTGRKTIAIRLEALRLAIPLGLRLDRENIRIALNLQSPCRMQGVFLPEPF